VHNNVKELTRGVELYIELKRNAKPTTKRYEEMEHIHYVKNEFENYADAYDVALAEEIREKAFWRDKDLYEIRLRPGVFIQIFKKTWVKKHTQKHGVGYGDFFYQIDYNKIGKRIGKRLCEVESNDKRAEIAIVFTDTETARALSRNKTKESHCTAIPLNMKSERDTTVKEIVKWLTSREVMNAVQRFEDRMQAFVM